jgi:hypothetical protein
LKKPIQYADQSFLKRVGLRTAMHLKEKLSIIPLCGLVILGSMMVGCASCRHPAGSAASGEEGKPTRDQFIIFTVDGVPLPVPVP